MSHDPVELLATIGDADLHRIQSPLNIASPAMPAEIAENAYRPPTRSELIQAAQRYWIAQDRLLEQARADRIVLEFMRQQHPKKSKGQHYQ